MTEVPDTEILFGPADYADEQCAAPVRWQRVVGLKDTLQQLWLVTVYRGGRPVERREEWRDVPTAD